MSTIPPKGEGDLEGGRMPEGAVDIGDALPEAPIRVKTVYDSIRELLASRGWVQGRQTEGGRLSLTAAIDLIVAMDAGSSAPAGPRLARRGRLQRHLRELAGTSSLTAWNDDRARTMGDIVQLLTFAAVAYPDD
jgi:hypothetical protein